MSGAQIALERAGIKVDNYFASEIDQYAIKVTQANYPDTIQLGCVKDIDLNLLPKIDLLIAGSPCQGFSFAGKQLNFNDPRSKLFFEYVRIKDEINPEYFLLENVKMKKEYQDVISQYLNIESLEINSALVSAQNRKRFYWTNIPEVGQPEDKNLYLRDIVHMGSLDRTVKDTERNLRHERDLSQKSLTCTATMYKGAGNNGMTLIRRCNQKDLSVLVPIECERLQTLPYNYTNHVSNTQRYKMIGNGFTIDVIAHILRNISKKG